MFDTLAPPLKPVLRAPAAGKNLRVFGGELTQFVTAADSAGRLTAGLYLAPPDNGPPVHLHQNEDELLIVIEGQFQFFIDGRWTEDVGPGSTVFLPRDEPHAFRNTGTTTGKLYVIVNSPHLEAFFERCEEPFHQQNGPDMAVIAAIGTEHGIEFVDVTV
jgi:mannose-6-phosphate isomerase-like protein (cupin superfamily)